MAASFEKISGEVQEKLPSWCPADYARVALIAAGASNPQLEIALEAVVRGVSPQQAHAELARVDALLRRLMASPTSDPKYIAELRQYGGQLQIAVGASGILKRAVDGVIAQAKKARPLDPDATADHAMVAQAVRGASDPHPVEPPIDWGRLSPEEFNAEKRKLGFV
jgi:hypothetical protein